MSDDFCQLKVKLLLFIPYKQDKPDAGKVKTTVSEHKVQTQESHTNFRASGSLRPSVATENRTFSKGLKSGFDPLLSAIYTISYLR